jgi:hypothetical protein
MSGLNDGIAPITRRRTGTGRAGLCGSALERDP